MQILHILTASLQDCQRVIAAALSAGFRESGAVSLAPSKSGETNPMVAVRSTGYSYDSIIGYRNHADENVSIVDDQYLQTMANIANERFQINAERITRFRAALLQQYHTCQDEGFPNNEPVWENAEARKQRKRAEGLARQQALKEQRGSDAADVNNRTEAESILDNMFK